MDDDLRAAERAARQGDPAAHANFRRRILQSGRFWAEPITDECLGPAWQLYNLPFENEKWNLVYSRGYLTEPEPLEPDELIPVRATFDEYVHRSTFHHTTLMQHRQRLGIPIASTLLEGAIALAMYDNKDTPGLSTHVAEYHKDQLEKEKEPRLTGTITYDGERATIVYMRLDGRKETKTVPFPDDAESPYRLAPLPTEEPGKYAVKPLPQTLAPLITAILGRDHARAAEALQYFSKRDYHNERADLQPIVLAHPDLSRRTSNGNRTLTLECHTSFIVCCSAHDGRMPAVGFRNAERVS